MHMTPRLPEPAVRCHERRSGLIPGVIGRSASDDIDLTRRRAP